MEPWEFFQKESLPYEAKLILAEKRAQEFYQKLNGKVYVAVGGLDSLTLLLFVRKVVDKDILGASISSLEDSSIQEVHKSLGNMEILQPLKSKVQVIADHGYPLISKRAASQIECLQIPDKLKQDQESTLGRIMS